jgi:hypothetical protein
MEDVILSNNKQEAFVPAEIIILFAFSHRYESDRVILILFFFFLF